MIRISKSSDRPQTLDKSYNTDEICSRLLADQNDKCYLCERCMDTDYEVEHFKSQANNTDLVQTWENLFAACSYCNGKKSNRFDHILNPTHYNMESLIHHSVDFIHQQVVLTSTDASVDASSTIELLSLIFNGRLKFRNLREQRFYNKFIQKLNFFSFAVDQYLSGKHDEFFPIIKEQLDIHSEYLGFKYAIIHSNKLLKQDFGSMTIWNKIEE